jgi:hypothetical protein
MAEPEHWLTVLAVCGTCSIFEQGTWNGVGDLCCEVCGGLMRGTVLGDATPERIAEARVSADG